MAKDKPTESVDVNIRDILFEIMTMLEPLDGEQISTVLRTVAFWFGVEDSHQ